VLPRRSAFAAKAVTLLSALALAATGCAATPEPHASWHAAHPGPALAQNRAAGTTPDSSGSTAGPAPKTSPTPTAGAPTTTAPAAPGTAPAAPPSSSPSPSKLPEDMALGQLRTTDGSVALTFDDGPGPFTPKILDLLREQHIKATFCLIGVNVQEYPQYVKQIVADGHTLCNHTWHHDEQIGRKPVDDIRADLQRTNDEIHKAVPDAPIKYFRNPGGNFTTASVQVAQDLGMAPLGWNVDPADWNVKKFQGQQMTDHIVSVVKKNTKSGSIVLSHDGGGQRDSTVAAYRALLPDLKSRFTLSALPT
jgi:peptidoglycan-N-acetylglucosamine deacetylase